MDQVLLQEHCNQEMVKILSLDYTFRQAVQSNNVEAAARIAVQSLQKVQFLFVHCVYLNISQRNQTKR